MPFKHNAARRHCIPKTRYRVQNWPAYEAGLKRRGDLTLWLDEAALAKWQAPRRTTPGGQARYSDAAIELVLMLRLVFHLALRQAEGFAASVLRLLGQTLRVPNHTTLSRRSRGFIRISRRFCTRIGFSSYQYGDFVVIDRLPVRSVSDEDSGYGNRAREGFAFIGSTLNGRFVRQYHCVSTSGRDVRI